MKQTTNYISAYVDLPAFNCPHCHVLAKQSWHYLVYVNKPDSRAITGQNQDFRVSNCQHCFKTTIWHSGNMIFPRLSTIEAPNEHLPYEVKRDYIEAQAILNDSPRGAAALLRLSIQKLCKHLGESGKNINDDIKSLVEKGLSVQVQQALDIVRVVGNEAVHPGTIDLRDNKQIATQLFKMVNFIAQKMIQEPKEIGDLFATLPQSTKDAIQKRDA